jgi:hypothetical protein
MNWRDVARPLLTVLVGIGIVVLIVVLIVKLMGGGSAQPDNTLDIGKYANTAATATLLIDSPTNLDQEHRQVKITVSQTQNTLDIMSGYQGNVIDSRTYENNSAAFGAFLQSLKLANFAKGNSKSTVDYRGYCPNGDRYVLTFNDGQTDKFTYWATSCSGQGTYKGAKGATLQLFRRQIAEKDFNQLTGPISIGF